MTQETKIRYQFGLVILLALVCGVISYPQAVKFIPPVFNVLNGLEVNKGLDLQGGIHLEYKADVSQIESEKVSDALTAAEAVAEAPTPTLRATHRTAADAATLGFVRPLPPRATVALVRTSPPQSPAGATGAKTLLARDRAASGESATAR